MAEIWEESEGEKGRRLARKRKQRQRVQMQPPPREVRIDECEREELRLAKQRKRMAVIRNADHPRRSARLQAEQLRLQQLTLLFVFVFFFFKDWQHATSKILSGIKMKSVSVSIK